MILVLFSETYPYNEASEQTFLEKEMGILTKKFERVIVVPRRCVGQLLPLPDGVEVDTSYAEYLSVGRFKSFFIALISPNMYFDLWKHPRLLGDLKALFRLVKFVGNAKLTRTWLLKWLSHKVYENAANCIFYTYWLSDTTFGIGMARSQRLNLSIVSRVHGYDLYEERHSSSYLPCREQTFLEVDKIFSASDAGTDYLLKKYPNFASKFETSLLGVAETGFKTKPSSHGFFRIVSCSHIVPLKRVELIMQAVADAASKRPDIKFEWAHFGDGEKRAELMAYIQNCFPANAIATLYGYVLNEQIFDFYRNNPVDVFLNVSETEGTPVSIMEAISCGIPVIATAVGGNVEIVTEQNGILLDPNPSVDEVAKALIAMYEHQLKDGSKREGSLQVWRSRYNSETNFSNFADKLISLRNNRG